MSELAIERTDTRVRKWGMLKIGISDYGAATVTVFGDPKVDPDDYFDKTTFKPKAFPVGVKELGYITTSGITDAKSVSSNSTSMLQSLTPVRSDLESIEKTLQGVFGESNAYTNALYHGLPVSAWTLSSHALSSSMENTSSRDSIGCRCVTGAKVPVGAPPTVAVGESDPASCGYRDSRSWSSLKSLSYWASERVGASAW